MKNVSKYLPWVATAGLVASLAMVVPAFAQTSVGANVGVGASVAGVTVQGGFHNGANGGMRRNGPMMAPGIVGTVTAISGTTLTVSSQPFGMMRPGMATSSTTTAPAPTIYTVDASNASIYKGSATTTVSLSSIATGDMVFVQGAVSGDSVTATSIHDGAGARVPGMGGERFHGMNGSTSTPPVSPIKGNGEPVIGGNVTAISGTTLTVTNASNVTYTIDASGATIVKNGTTTAISNIAVGDTLVVQGTVNGTSVTASSVLDQGVKASATASTGGASGAFHANASLGGIFGAIGGFFQHLFGF